eukprot:scaffold96791_cov67-Phaeocystis_antarctica.AAC.3
MSSTLYTHVDIHDTIPESGLEAQLKLRLCTLLRQRCTSKVTATHSSLQSHPHDFEAVGAIGAPFVFHTKVDGLLSRPAHVSSG